MKHTDLTKSFVSAITNFDIDEANAEDIQAIRNLLYQRKVVAIKSQRISRDTFLNFTQNFGRPELFKLKNYHDPDYPGILVINNRNSNNAVGARKLGNMWHSDSSYLPAPLPLTFLHAQKLPEHGGDTLFLDMECALDSLPLTLREQIAGRQAEHDVRWTYKVKEDDIGESVQEIFARLAISFPAVSHPTLIVHPKTGRQSLYMNPGYTLRVNGYSDDEGRAVLAKVFENVVRHEKIFSYKWEPNDLLIWDNRAVIHCATELPRDVERLMYRIGINDGAFFAT